MQPDLRPRAASICAVQSDWLQVNFDASAVSLQRVLVKTSYPPKQLLQFRLDDVRYTLYVTRTDFTPRRSLLRGD